MDVFKLSRSFFDWSFENPELISPLHSAIFFFAIEHCNRLWWKEKFWFPTSMVMEAIWIRKWETYNKAYQDLIQWGFIKEIEKSKNQYSSCIISILSATPKNGKALDKALVKHGKKHSESTGESTGDIDIQETNKQETINNVFLEFWNIYPKKIAKPKCEEKFRKLSEENKMKALKNIKLQIIKWKIQKTEDKYIPHPLTWINEWRYDDDVEEIKPTQEEIDEYRETCSMRAKLDIVSKYRPEIIPLRAKWANATQEEIDKWIEIRHAFELAYNLR